MSASTDRPRRSRAMLCVGLACFAMGGVILHRLLLWGTLLAFEVAWLDSGRSIDEDPTFAVAVDRWTLAIASLATIAGAAVWLRGGGGHAGAREADGADATSLDLSDRGR